MASTLSFKQLKIRNDSNVHGQRDTTEHPLVVSNNEGALYGLMWLNLEDTWLNSALKAEYGIYVKANKTEPNTMQPTG